jgi:hypothetical protein
MADVIRSEMGCLRSIKKDRSFIGRKGSGDNIKEGGLSRAIGPDQTCDRSFFDLKVNPVKSRQTPKVLCDVLAF